LSRSYFNVLLNRPLDTTIDIQEDFSPLFPAVPDNTEIESRSLQQREELQQLNHAITAANNHVKLNQSTILPGVTAVVDYGFQDDARKKQALLEKRILEKQSLETEIRIRLQLQDAVRSLQVARQVLAAADETQRSAEASFAIIAKKYEQQMIPQIEYIQARNEFTAARTAHLIAGFDLHIKEAQLESAAALYPL